MQQRSFGVAPIQYDNIWCGAWVASYSTSLVVLRHSLQEGDLQECLAQVCRQHWLWVVRTHCLSAQICLHAAHTWVCVHLVCLLNSQFCDGWTTCTSWTVPVHFTPAAHFVDVTPHDLAHVCIKKAFPDGVHASEH